jgi:hypothetical protein
MSGLVRQLPAPRSFRPTRSWGMHSVRERLLGFERSWLYEHWLIIVHERLLRSMIAVARREHEAQLARQIALVRLPWQATDNHPVLRALRSLQDLYAHEQRHLSTGTRIFLGRVWQEVLDNPDREPAFCAFEVATLLALRRALRNGTLWIYHILAFRSRERLFIPADRWQAQRRSHFRRLGLPTDPAP